MAFSLLFSLAISFIIILSLEYKLKSVSMVLWGGLFVFFFLPHAVDIFIGSLEYTRETYNKASLFALLFNIIYLTTRLFLANSKRIRVFKIDLSLGEEINSLFIRNLFIFLIISFAFLIYFILNTFGGFFEFTWIDIFDSRGGFSYMVYTYLFSMSIPLLFLSHYHKRHFITISTLIILVLVIFLFRIRAYLIPITIPFILNYMFSEKFKINIYNLNKLLIFSLLIIILIVSLGVFKASGTLSNFYYSINFSEFAKMLYGIAFSKYGELGLRNAFYFFLEHDNQFSNFGDGLGYIRLFMMPLPSSLSLGLKPQDFAMDMAMAYDPINSTPGVNSMHPTLYGDCYANLGWYGVLLGIFWGFFAFVGDALTRHMSKNILYLSMFVSFCYAYTLIARGAVYNAVYNVYFILLTHSILFYILRKSKIKKI